MPDPTKFNIPCNCYGTCSRFEMEQEFHEMGIEGCVRDPKKFPRNPIREFVDLATKVAAEYTPSEYLKTIPKE